MKSSLSLEVGLLSSLKGLVISKYRTEVASSSVLDKIVFRYEANEIGWCLGIEFLKNLYICFPICGV